MLILEKETQVIEESWGSFGVLSKINLRTNDWLMDSPCWKLLRQLKLILSEIEEMLHFHSRLVIII